MPEQGPDMEPEMDAGEPEPDAGVDVGDASPEVDAPSEGCLADEECALGSFCDDALDPPECLEGCRDGANCPEGTDCDDTLEEPVCVEGCRQNEQCPEGQVCDTVGGEISQCREGCRSAEDCPFGLCAPELQVCVSGCFSDDDCLDGEECDEDFGGCVGFICQSDGVCGAEQYCDVDGSSRCVPGCRVTPDSCGEGLFCVAQTRECAPGCIVDGVCPEDEYCNLETNLCQRGCRDDFDCGLGLECETVRFGQDPAEQACVFPSCEVNRDCDNDQYCGFEEATDRLACAFGCRIDRDNCDRGFECNPDTRVCDPETCVDDDECSVGQVCGGEAICRLGCRLDTECAEGEVCSEDSLLCSCQEDADCPSGQVCDIGQCVEGCERDRDCVDGAFCDPDFNVCLFECRDDVFEPNNELFEATNVLVGDFDARVCYDGDDVLAAQDCFMLDLLEEEQLGMTLRVSLGFARALGDLDLVLIDPDFNEVTSETQEDTETLEGIVTFPGAWFFCVLPSGEGFGGTYEVSVELLP